MGTDKGFSTDYCGLTAIAATCIRKGILRSLWAKAVNDPAMKGCDTSVTLMPANFVF